MAEEDNQPDNIDDDIFPNNQEGDSHDQSAQPQAEPSILQQINNRLKGDKPSVERAKKLSKQYNDPYAKHRANKNKIEQAINTTEPVAKPFALKLKARKTAYDAMAKANKKALDNPNVSGSNAKEPVAHKALEIADKLDNQLKRQASKMKQEQRLIKQQELIAKAGPYGRLAALLLGCKNWCLGHAIIICVATGGLGYAILKLTGSI